MDDLKETDWPI